MKVVFLGTGTSHGVPMIGCDCAVCTSDDPRDTRTRASIVVEMNDGTTVLVDTSPDLRMQALSRRLRRLDLVIYTHAHADHVAGLDDLRPFNALSGGPMPLYGDAPTIDELRQRFAYAFDRRPPAGGGVPKLRLWTIGGPFCAGRQEVVPVPIMHGRRSILGFRFGRFAYLTDCSAIPASSLTLLRDLDVLVLDALRHEPHPTHFTLEEAQAMARQVGARRTYFTHMSHQLGHTSTCASLPPDMTLAYDGLTLDIRNGAMRP